MSPPRPCGTERRSKPSPGLRRGRFPYLRGVRMRGIGTFDQSMSEAR